MEAHGTEQLLRTGLRTPLVIGVVRIGLAREIIIWVIGPVVSEYSLVWALNGCFYKLGGPFCGFPERKIPIILGSILGPLILGSSQIS